MSTYQSVVRNLGVELEPVLYRGDGAQDGEPVDAGLDVGGRAVLISQHLGHAGDLVTWPGGIFDYSRQTLTIYYCNDNRTKCLLIVLTCNLVENFCKLVSSF